MKYFDSIFQVGSLLPGHTVGAGVSFAQSFGDGLRFSGYGPEKNYRIRFTP